jgi:hypothetical protein
MNSPKDSRDLVPEGVIDCAMNGHPESWRETIVHTQRGEVSFIVHVGLDFQRNRLGHKRGSTTWHTFRCNDPNCPAVAGVRWDVLEAFIAEGLN